MEEPIRFCVVDDHDIVLFGAEAMASREKDVVFCGGTADARSATDLIDRERPDILLLDLRLGSTNSFSLCKELRTKFPDLAIVMFTAFGNEDLLDKAIKAGAVGYVLKDTSTAGLPEVLRTVNRYGSYFDPRMANSALLSSMGDKSRIALSERELTILRLIAKGKDNHEIAEQVQLSVHMVKFHVATLLRRYEVKRRAELVRVLMERQLL